MVHKPRFACLYMFLKYIFVLVFGTIPEHCSSALLFGAWRDECAMVGLLEPSVVLGLVTCCFDYCMYASMHCLWLSVSKIG